MLNHVHKKELAAKCVNGRHQRDRDHPKTTEIGYQPRPSCEPMIGTLLAGAYVDIEQGFERKLAARLAYTSQTTDPVALVENWRARATSIGEPVGLALADAFTVLILG
jgi:hypothetical protein